MMTHALYPTSEVRWSLWPQQLLIFPSKILRERMPFFVSFFRFTLRWKGGRWGHKNLIRFLSLTSISPFFFSEIQQAKEILSPIFAHFRSCGQMRRKRPDCPNLTFNCRGRTLHHVSYHKKIREVKIKRHIRVTRFPGSRSFRKKIGQTNYSTLTWVTGDSATGLIHARTQTFVHCIIQWLHPPRPHSGVNLNISVYCPLSNCFVALNVPRNYRKQKKHPPDNKYNLGFYIFRGKPG